MTTYEQVAVRQTEPTQEAPAQELTACEVMQLKTRRYIWYCPGCDQKLPFIGGELEAVPFLIIRHLLRMHGTTPERIVAVEPALATEVHQYKRQMGMR